MSNQQSAISNQQYTEEHTKWPGTVLPFLCCWLLIAGCWLLCVDAGQLPSLFRGVVVADNALGIRVVSVEETSQAYLADLRPEDVIVQINETSIHSIDDFAIVSQALKGQATKATVFVLRNGQPREVILHLYSYPVLRQWGLAFVPEHDIRFADSKAGVDYWTRMARGFVIANDREHALNAYLNALHNAPTQLDVALKVSDLLWQIAQQRLQQQQLPAALMALQEGAVILERLFDQPLDRAQLESIKAQLEQTLTLLHTYKRGKELAK